MTDPMRVLVVEDEAAILMQLEDLIEDEGHTVVATAMSSHEAIAKIGETSPELVLLDLHLLGGTSGLDVARHARGIDSVEVVFMTANPTRLPDDLEGAIGVFAKPVSRAALVATIRYLAECLRTPPPLSSKPSVFVLEQTFQRRMAAAAQ